MITQEEFEDAIIQTEKPKYKYGDQVASKATGFPGIGTIISIEPGLIFKAIRPNVNWGLYPDWSNKYVYMVKFETPRKNVTYEEYKSFNTNFKEEVLQEYYDKLTETKLIVYPEDDLEYYE